MLRMFLGVDKKQNFVPHIRLISAFNNKVFYKKRPQKYAGVARVLEKDYGGINFSNFVKYVLVRG